LRTSALLALEDGTVYHGESIGAIGQSVGEVVFNTAMTGYQEILTDPSYCRQIVTLTYPHIGNVGVNAEDEESANIHASGLIIRELSPVVSSWRSEEALDTYLERHNVVGLAGIDTRSLTRLLREKGAMKGCIVAGDNIDVDAAIAAAQAFDGLKGMDLAKVVSTEQVYQWDKPCWHLSGESQAVAERFHVVAYDFGAKSNILRMLVERGCRLTVVPAQTSAEEVLALNPDGVFLSNGPGDPEPCTYAIEAIKTLLDKNLPIFGICLGHQLLALACGAKTVKMKFGHHGANHPVQELTAGLVMITSQNHGFAVDETSLPDTLSATHISLFDGSLQGIHHNTKPAFSFQGHPEASPGPQDAAPLFDHFIDLLETATGK
jgi:carbamoyl-phosphate synthase small subunit